MNDMYVVWSYDDNKPDLFELYHHGIKNQKWGVKNGPPYPLDRETKREAYGDKSNSHKHEVKEISTKNQAFTNADKVNKRLEEVQTELNELTRRKRNIYAESNKEVYLSRAKRRNEGNLDYEFHDYDKKSNSFGKKPKEPKELEKLKPLVTEYENLLNGYIKGTLKNRPDHDTLVKTLNEYNRKKQNVSSKIRRNTGIFYDPNNVDTFPNPSWALDRKTNKVTYADDTTKQLARNSGLTLDEYVHLDDRIRDLYDEQLSLLSLKNNRT